ncbi:hypothetical protein H8A95_29250 [Bradyrhizobium sp. Pear76]|uniref:hypothetical protein n=1 Tax=Bradyrhizobium oropedii TaxID=1571201 RepID=UPI001E50044C|nr:hypothetical protein [Bradyrhizobium oropedii]MCC8966298.1 hypothetical protein [Bradyrhizobium oropedii]
MNRQKEIQTCRASARSFRQKQMLDRALERSARKSIKKPPGKNAQAARPLAPPDCGVSKSLRTARISTGFNSPLRGKFAVARISWRPIAQSTPEHDAMPAAVIGGLTGPCFADAFGLGMQSCDMKNSIRYLRSPSAVGRVKSSVQKTMRSSSTANCGGLNFNKNSKLSK